MGKKIRPSNGEGIAVTTSEKVDILENNIREMSKPLLDILLKDHTTGKNIIWATRDYQSLGVGYSETNEIVPCLITGLNSKVIQPRITKVFEKQANRTKDKAEVFTPSWVCNAQNNLIDEQWFGKANIFNIPHGCTWKTVHSKIEFGSSTEQGQITWEKYIDIRRLEITCGEAPYLVSRYDTVTGEAINIKRRIGLLDRKLRIVNENVTSDDEWLYWATRAFQSVYGYEFQGDNLILARENILYTFIDYYMARFKKSPEINELKRIATIISWNIWQMDAKTCAVPFAVPRDDESQLTLFDIAEGNTEPVQTLCLIKDWRAKRIIEFISLVKGEE